MSTNTIVLKSSDGQTFEVEEAIARQFQNTAHRIEDDCANKEIQISGKILAMMIEYCKTHHVDDDANTSSDEDLKKWDEQFIMQTDDSTIFDLLFAAHRLNFFSLLDLTRRTLKDMIRDPNKDIEIPSKYTLKEVQAVLNESVWASY